MKTNTNNPTNITLKRWYWVRADEGWAALTLDEQWKTIAEHPNEGQVAEEGSMPCCYYNCLVPGTIHIGPNGGDSHWICFRHLDRWNQNRARFLADGGGCEMEELGELLEDPVDQRL